MPPLNDSQQQSNGSLTQKGQLHVIDRACETTSIAKSLSARSGQLIWPDGKRLCRKRLIKSRKSKTQDSTDSAATNHHVTRRSTKWTNVWIIQVTCTRIQTQTLFQWTWTQPPPPCSNGSQMKSEHNSGPKNDVSDADLKGTWLALVQRTPIGRTTQTHVNPTLLPLQVNLTTPLVPQPSLPHLQDQSAQSLNKSTLSKKAWLKRSAVCILTNRTWERAFTMPSSRGCRLGTHS